MTTTDLTAVEEVAVLHRGGGLMNCYDCAADGDQRGAVAVCVDCGAGLCVEHAVTVRHWLTRTRPLLRVERVEPLARLIRCESCQAANVARGDIAEPALVAASKT